MAATANVQAHAASGEALRLGMGHNLTSEGYQYLSGTVDEVLLYNRALSAQEIKSIFAGSPAAHWSMDDGSGATATDGENGR